MLRVGRGYKRHLIDRPPACPENTPEHACRTLWFSLWETIDKDVFPRHPLVTVRYHGKPDQPDQLILSGHYGRTLDGCKEKGYQETRC